MRPGELLHLKTSKSCHIVHVRQLQPTDTSVEVLWGCGELHTVNNSTARAYKVMPKSIIEIEKLGELRTNINSTTSTTS